MKSLIKCTVMLIILVISLTSANITNQALEKTQDNIVKSYKKRRTEERSFKNIQEAEEFITSKGTKIESIAKELGIKYVMSDDKGLFYHSDNDLNRPEDSECKYNSIQIGWATGIAEYGEEYSKASTTSLHENMYIFSYNDFSKKEKFKDDLAVKFIYKYLIKVENKNIDYDDFLNDIQETYLKYYNERPEENVRLQLADGLYMTFKVDSKMEVTMNVAYRKRIIKEANPDFTDYFITAKNSKEVKDRIQKIYDHYYKLNEEAGSYKYRGVYTKYKDYESVAIRVNPPTVNTYKYNKKLYPELADEDKIYSINLSILSNKTLTEEYNYNLIKYEEHIREQAAIMYEFTKNEVYNGKYKMPKDEFISKYVKGALNEKLNILYNSYNLRDIYYITPGVTSSSEGGIEYNIPLNFS